MGQTLLLLHEGALVAHGFGTFPDAIGHARDQAAALLAASPGHGRPVQGEAAPPTATRTTHG